MSLPALGRSLTLRLGLLYAVSTLLILVGVSIYLIDVIDRHFAEQDLVELRGKLELSSRLIAKAHAEDRSGLIPRYLDDALVGHHHLSLGVSQEGREVYRSGHVALPEKLYAAAAPALEDAAMMTWDQGEETYRGAAIAMRPGLAGPDYAIAVALDTAHHSEFIDHFKLALAVVLALATLVAVAIGWAVSRFGLSPLQRTAQLAREITAERLEARLPTDRVPPELEDLTASFNAMLDRLRDSITRLSSFAADLAHEMRTPVSNLMMETQVMLSQPRTNEAYREVLASNLEEFERLARTIGDMLFLAKADNGLIVPSREIVDLETEVAELIEFYEVLADEKHIRLVRKGRAATGGDRLMLRRALSNLISNAIRYAPSGSDIAVSLSALPGEAEVIVENRCLAPPPEPLERLFDRFHRGDPARRDTGDGAGLGLAITHSIAVAHGGNVFAERRGEKIRFVLRLPDSR